MRSLQELQVSEIEDLRQYRRDNPLSPTNVAQQQGYNSQATGPFIVQVVLDSTTSTLTGSLTTQCLFKYHLYREDQLEADLVAANRLQTNSVYPQQRRPALGKRLFSRNVTTNPPPNGSKFGLAIKDPFEEDEANPYLLIVAYGEVEDVTGCS